MDLTQLVGNLGFPIAVATYTLVVLNKTIQKNTEIMQRIANKLDIQEPTTTPSVGAK